MALSVLSQAHLMVNSVLEKRVKSTLECPWLQRSRSHAVLCMMSLADREAAKQTCSNGHGAAAGGSPRKPGGSGTLWSVTEARRVISEMSLCVPWALCCKGAQSPSKQCLCCRQALEQCWALQEDPAAWMEEQGLCFASRFVFLEHVTLHRAARLTAHCSWTALHGHACSGCDGDTKGPEMSRQPPVPAAVTALSFTWAGFTPREGEWMRFVLKSILWPKLLTWRPRKEGEKKIAKEKYPAARKSIFRKVLKNKSKKSSANNCYVN